MNFNVLAHATTVALIAVCLYQTYELSVAASNTRSDIDHAVDQCKADLTADIDSIRQSIRVLAKIQELDLRKSGSDENDLDARITSLELQAHKAFKEQDDLARQIRMLELAEHPTKREYENTLRAINFRLDEVERSMPKKDAFGRWKLGE